MTATTTGVEVTVPDIGDFAAVPIIEVHVAPVTRSTPRTRC